MGISVCEWKVKGKRCGKQVNLHRAFSVYTVSGICCHGSTRAHTDEQDAIDEWEANQAALRHGPPPTPWIVRVLVRAFDALADRQAAWLADVDVDALNAELVRLRNENEGLKNANH